MSATIEDQVERYVKRAILTQEDGPPPPGSVPARRRSELGGRSALLVALVVFAVGIGAGIALTRGATSSPATDADLSSLTAPRTTVSVPGWKTFTELLESDLETSVTVYVREDAPDHYSTTPGEPPVAVYDEPDGTLVGYFYPWVGIVDNTTLASGTFDPAAARIRRWGCDPLDVSDRAAFLACTETMRESPYVPDWEMADARASDAGDPLAAAKTAIAEQMEVINAAWRSSPRAGVTAEAAAAWPEGAWTWEMFACPPGELTADAWLKELEGQGYARSQHLVSLELDPTWVTRLTGAAGEGQSPTGDVLQVPAGDVFLVHGTFTNGDQVQEGDAHWVVEDGTARWIASPCVSP